MAKINTNLKTRIGNIKMKNPVMIASGTFEYNEVTKYLIDVKRFGAVVTKTITLEPRKGNLPPRTCETYAGTLNAIGLQNKGVGAFLRQDLLELKLFKIPIIASVAGKNREEFEKIAKKLDKRDDIAGIELNLSCPNIKRHILFAQDAKLTYNIVASARKATKKTLIAKLTPNVTDIREIAKAAEDAGADAVSLVNTLLGMSIDIEKRKPKLGNITGGLSGPAIKPVALRMVWEVSKTVKVPVVGMGGIASSEDAIEFIIAGASAVAIGTASFINPNLGIEIVEGIKKYLLRHGIQNTKSLVASLEVKA